MDVQISSEMKLPLPIQKDVLGETKRFLQAHREWFNSFHLDLQLRNEGRQVECLMNLTTDIGEYRAHVLGWDVRQLVREALSRIDTQLSRKVLH
jgi:hypothetical protein